MDSADAVPMRVGDIWFGQEAEHRVRDLAAALAAGGRAPSSLPGLRQLARTTRDLVDERAAHALAGLLGQLDVGTLIVAGWRTYRRLTSAADRTLAKPGSEETVEADSHHIITTHELPVDVLIDGKKITTLHFGHKTDFELNAVVAVVKRGDLVGLRAGRCAATMTLTLDEAEFAHTRTSLSLPYLVRLQPGIPLRPPGHELRRVLR